MIVIWPSQRPDYKFDDHGWFEDCNREVLSRYLSDKTRTIIELGSWLGKSTRFMLDKAPNALLFAVDTWRGSPEFVRFNIGNRLTDALGRFMANCWEYRDRIEIIKSDSSAGLRWLHKSEPDLIYVDASHEYGDVLSDLKHIDRLFPRAQVVGDDWNLESVKQAVLDMKKEISYIDNCWAYK